MAQLVTRFEWANVSHISVFWSIRDFLGIKIKRTAEAQRTQRNQEVRGIFCLGSGLMQQLPKILIYRSRSVREAHTAKNAKKT
ncbi:hypothetical protein VB620_20240 [Nodularia harveyana UHCC-0300]|uniref:Transposase n=1 Tax=Nodularia harveyana UHCC-0300 TaxID=2974287 RepID=A0ABU5UJG3_9CYAN|nr:hypothetical protein [Nodularia harveyana]MEA5583660.1 hypothetical protein [Nodularia harveyana UHCC-0300]